MDKTIILNHKERTRILVAITFYIEDLEILEVRSKDEYQKKYYREKIEEMKKIEEKFYK